jgi:hypothetical protein
MSDCRVFNPQTEISELKTRVAQLEQELVQLRRSLKESAVYGPLTYAGWPPNSLPTLPDSFPSNFNLEIK